MISDQTFRKPRISVQDTDELVGLDTYLDLDATQTLRVKPSSQDTECAISLA